MIIITFIYFFPSSIVSDTHKKSHILLLSTRDGRSDIVQAARGYCEQVYEQLAKSTAVDVGLIDSLLKGKLNFLTLKIIQLCSAFYLNVPE